MSSSNTESTRWWEFYVVRYGMGTVIGAIIFFGLCGTVDALKPLLFNVDKDPISSAHIIIFSAYGLAFCYLSSAPILVFHSGRFLFKYDGGVSLRRSLILYSVPVLIFILASLIFNVSLLVTLTLSLTSLIIWTQIIVIFLVFKEQDSMYEFYSVLSDKRSTGEAGLVESYKHLREHGNSFFIVFMEIIFAVALYSVSQVVGEHDVEAISSAYIITITIWVTPAVFMWFVGNLIENKFSKAE